MYLIYFLHKEKIILKTLSFYRSLQQIPTFPLAYNSVQLFKIFLDLIVKEYNLASSWQLWQFQLSLLLARFDILLLVSRKRRLVFRINPLLFQPNDCKIVELVSYNLSFLATRTVMSVNFLQNAKIMIAFNCLSYMCNLSFYVSNHLIFKKSNISIFRFLNFQCY